MNWSERDIKHIWHPCSHMKDYEEVPPIVIEKGEGIYLYDTQGKKYADVISSWWCNLLGHCNPRINNAVKKQIDVLEHVIFSHFSHTPAIELCEKLVKVLPNGLNKFHFTDNGSAAIEAAMKMSFQYFLQKGYSNKKRFMALSGAYHGETIGALSACGCSEYAEIYKPILLDIIKAQGPDCYRCPLNLNRDTCDAECFETTAKIIEEYAESVCGFLVEPILQGAVGMRIYPPSYLIKLKKACDKYNIIMIADEIATGFGRTGKMFACNHGEITPHIMCLSKGLTGGYLPMAIVAVDDNIFNEFYGGFNDNKSFLHSHTYSGNPLACASAIEVLNILDEEKILEKASENAKYLKEKLNKYLINHENIGEIRTIGLINAIELVKDKKSKRPFDANIRKARQVYIKALEKGLIVRPLGDVIYLNPPLTITRDEIDEVCLLLRDAVYEML